MLRDIGSRFRDFIAWVMGQRRELVSAHIAPALEQAPPPAAEVQIGYRNLRDIHDVLDRLPTYFKHLRKMRAVDEDGYRIFATIGGQLGDDNYLMRKDALPEGFLESPPTIRCFFSGEEENDKSAANDSISVGIGYIQKLAGGTSYVCRDGSFAALPSGLCYRVVGVFITKIGPFAESFIVHISPAGAIIPLRERRIVRQKVSGGSFSRQEFGYPAWLEDNARRNGTSAEEVAREIFCIIASCHRPKDAILVRASKGGMAAAWTVSRNDAKRFFRKRDTGTAADGRRKRILHYVAPFERTKGGIIESVREHFRGERSFAWMGYNIQVSGLGFHHDDFFESSISGYEVEQPAKPMLSMGKVSRMMADYYSKPYFLSRRDKAA